MKCSARINKEDAEKLDIILKTLLEFDFNVYENQFYDKGIVNIQDEKLRTLEYERLFSIIGSKGYADYIESNSYLNSIERNKETKNFLDNGGFVKLFQDELDTIEKTENVEKLKTKNLELQNENLEFSQTIRKHEAAIRDLEIKIKGIELLKQYWWFIGLCIFSGGILKEFIDLLIANI